MSGKLDLSRMFANCGSFTGSQQFSLTLPTTLTGTLNMNNMFYNCTSFTGAGLTNLNFSGVSGDLNLFSMFHNCSNELFTGEKLQLTLPTTLTGNLNMANMFYNCTNFTGAGLQTLDFRGVSGTLKLSYMFYNCTSFTGEGLTNLDFSGVSGTLNMHGMFLNCTSFIGTNLNTWTLSDNVNVTGIFFGCENLDGDLSGWCVTVEPTDRKQRTILISLASQLVATRETNVIIGQNSSLNWNEEFQKMLALEPSEENKKIQTYFTESTNPYDFILYKSGIVNTRSYYPQIKTSNVDGGVCKSAFVFEADHFIQPSTDSDKKIFQPQTNDVFKKAIQQMKENNSLILTVADNEYPIEEWDVSKVNDFSNAFADNQNLTDQNLSSWFSPTTHTLNMFGMFFNCTNFTGVGLTNLDFSGVSGNLYLSRMFFDCTNFTGENLQLTLPTTLTGTLDLSYMFLNCTSFTGEGLQTLNFSGVSGNLDLSGMFFNCSNELFTGENLQLTLPTTLGNLDMSGMFNNCTNFIGEGLQTLDFSGVSGILNFGPYV